MPKRIGWISKLRKESSKRGLRRSRFEASASTSPVPEVNVAWRVSFGSSHPRRVGIRIQGMPRPSRECYPRLLRRPTFRDVDRPSSYRKSSGANAESRGRRTSSSNEARRDSQVTCAFVSSRNPGTSRLGQCGWATEIKDRHAGRLYPTGVFEASSSGEGRGVYLAANARRRSLKFGETPRLSPLSSRTRP